MVYKIKSCSDYGDDFYKVKYNLLSETQRKRVDTLKDIKDKKLSILGLSLAGELLHRDPKEIYYIDGKPSHEKAFLSITHKYPYVGVCISTKPIGIDIETIRDIDKTTLRYLKAHDSLEALIEWTKNESLFKSALDKNYKFKTMLIDKSFVMTICEEA